MTLLGLTIAGTCSWAICTQRWVVRSQSRLSTICTLLRIERRIVFLLMAMVFVLASVYRWLLCRKALLAQRTTREPGPVTETRF